MKDFMYCELVLIKNMALTKTHKQIADLLECEVDDVTDVIDRTFKGVQGLQTYQDKVNKRNEKKAAMPKTVKIQKPEKIKEQKPVKEIKPKVRQAKKVKAIDPELERRKIEREKMAKITQQNNESKRARRERGEPKFATKKIDYSKMQLVKVDKKISIYVDPKKNIREQVEAFKQSQYKKYFDQD